MIPRRRFLQAAGGLLLPATGWAVHSALGSRPALPAIAEIALDRSEPGLARGRLVAAAGPVSIDGNTVRAVTYNGAFPGPLLRVREGETVRLRLENRLDRLTNLHFHGLSVPPGGRADNVWIHVPAGEHFDYEFTVPRGDAGLHWFHPHIHGATAPDMFRGLTGTILVEGERDFERGLDCDDRICVLKDVAVEKGRIPDHHPMTWSAGREGDWLLVNGVRRPVMHARRSLVRLRLLNASNARYWRLKRSDGEALAVIAHDGRYLETPQAVAELLLVPGARAEVLLPLHGDDPLDLLYLPTHRRGITYTPEQPILSIVPPPARTSVALPARLDAWTPFDAGAADAERDIVLSLFNICGRFMDPNRVDIRTRTGAREIWRVRNVDIMDHPFHLHTWHYEVLDVNGRPPPYRARLDMLNVREGDVARLGIHFAGHSGRTLYHCHFAEHADSGMMAVLQVE